jgi:hypothetical protein
MEKIVSLKSLAILLLFIPKILMANSTPPAGCFPLPINGDNFNIKAKKATLILINNQSANNLWLTHPVNDPSASAGWTSQLDKGQWSALVTDKDFVIGCIEFKPGHEQQVPCEEVITGCVLKKVSFPKDSKGGYWAVENSKKKELVAKLNARGIEKRYK